MLGGCWHHDPMDNVASEGWAPNRTAPRDKPNAIEKSDPIEKFAPIETLDRHILSLLARDGRMSYTDIGKATGLSTSAAQQRVRRLEQRGVIQGYAARIVPEAVGLMLTAFVAVRPFEASQPDDTPQRLEGFPEVVSCYSVAGDASYLLKVQVAAAQQLEELLTRIRTKGGVSTTTTIVLSVPYQDRPPFAVDVQQHG